MLCPAPRSLLALLLALPLLAAPAAAQQIPEDSVRIIGIFAHPDDGEYKMGGTAARLAAAGHQIKFVSLTNGDAGHHEQGGGALARRRRAEAKEAADRLGIAAYEVLDYHDAELMPTLDVRRDVIRLIREWDADVVIGLRPNDYHPDHRNAGRVVQDAAYMVQVPNVVSRVEPTDGNPVFLYVEDRFTKPAPFEADVAVPIDTAMARKVDALDAHVSQMYEWLPWVGDYLDEVPESEAARREWLGQRIRNRSSIDADVRTTLEAWYGAARARQIDFAEAFEVTEYGHQPSETELRRIFPMLPAR
jgi:LmbE family N-acetylglucosaminyl deacetylase